ANFAMHFSLVHIIQKLVESMCRRTITRCSPLDVAVPLEAPRIPGPHEEITMTNKKSARRSRPLPPALLRKMNAYWRAANYLSVGQIYLYDNPLLKKPLKLEHVKPRLLGHWGTTPGLNFLYVHLNRVIRQQDLNAIFIAGPGHGGPAMVANTYLEGS